MKRIYVAACFLAMIAISAYSANGFAVSVQFRFNGGGAANCPDNSDGFNDFWRGSILKFPVTGNAAGNADTLFSSSKGLAYYPAINLAGTKVAFYRWGCKVAGSSLTGCSDPSYISVVDVATKAVTNLCALPHSPGREHALDWPAGDWIYYVRPATTTDGDPAMWESTDIWRVNAVTLVNERAVYINDGRNPMPGVPSGWGPIFPAYLRRFSLSINADRAGLQCVNFGSNYNNAYTFAPPAGNILTNGCFVGGAGSCNASLSTSGGYEAGYSQSAHDRVELTKLAGANGPEPYLVYVSDIRSWSGTSINGTAIDGGGECIRWAVNSDKWICQQLGWYGHAGNIHFGSNQVLANWVDKQAIVTSRNSKISQSFDAIYYCNCPGDFWIDGGSANVGKYEGADGTWRTPSPNPNPTSIALNQNSIQSTPSLLSARIDPAGFLKASLFAPGRSSVRITDLHGRTIFSRAGLSQLSLPASMLKSGVYLISEQSENRTESVKVSIAR